MIWRISAEAIGSLVIFVVGVLGSTAIVGILASCLMHSIVRRYGYVSAVIAWYWSKKRGDK